MSPFLDFDYVTVATFDSVADEMIWMNDIVWPSKINFALLFDLFLQQDFRFFLLLIKLFQGSFCVLKLRISLSYSKLSFVCY